MSGKVIGDQFIAALLDEGRVTIPQELRELHRIKKGDKVRLILEKVYKSDDIKG